MESGHANIENLEASIDKLRAQTYLENQSRRCNIRVDRISELTDENWDKTKQKLKNVLAEKLNLSEVPHIKTAHRTGSRRNPDRTTKTKQRTIMCKLYDWKQKEHIMMCKENHIEWSLCQAILADVREELGKTTIRDNVKSKK